MEAIRHGDVVLVNVGEFPASKQLRKKVKNVTLAEGELTGHTHVLSVLDTAQDLLISRGVSEVLEDLDGRRGGTAWMVEVPEGGAELTHEEHDRIEVKPGKWLAFQQREAWTDPNARTWRQSYVYD